MARSLANSFALREEFLEYFSQPHNLRVMKFLLTILDLHPLSQPTQEFDMCFLGALSINYKSGYLKLFIQIGCTCLRVDLLEPITENA